MLSWKDPFEELVVRSLSASPFTKPVFTPGGWHVVKNVYWNVSVTGLYKWVNSHAENWVFVGSFALYKKVVSPHDISGISFIVGWCLFACSIKCLQCLSWCSSLKRCVHGMLPYKFVLVACVAFQVCIHGVCRLLSLFSWRVLPPTLYSWRVSPSKLVFMACVALKLVFSSMCDLFRIFMQ